MKLLFILYILTCKILFADFTLEKEYYFSDEDIRSSDIFKNIKKDFLLFKIAKKKTKYRIKSDKIIKIFKKHSIKISSKSNVVTFLREYDFDMQDLHVSLKKYYKNHYKNLDIKSLHVRPKSYMKKLPESYKIIIPPKNYHNNNGTFYLKTKSKKRLFFDYTIDADIPIITAKRTIKRKENLTPFNTQVKIIKFKSFKSPPLQKIQSSKKWCAKIRLKKGRILSKRDVKEIPLVKKDQNVRVIIRDGNLHVELLAKAKKDGALYDMITIEKRDGEHLKAKVIGANTVEIR